MLRNAFAGRENVALKYPQQVIAAVTISYGHLLYSAKALSIR